MTVRATDANWHDASAYESIVQTDRSLLMWEWLRRDPDYRKFSIGRATDPVHDLDGVRVFQLTDSMAAAPWGLRFR